MPWRLLCLALLLPSIPATVRAQCPGGSLPGALTARLDKAAVPVLESVLASELPGTYALPEEPTTLLDCPIGFDDTTVTPRNGELELRVRRVAITLVAGAIELDADLEVFAAADLEMVLCAMPDADCHGTMSAQQVSVFARAQPRVQGCQLTTNLTALEIQVEPNATDVQISACGLYEDVATLLYDYFRASIIAYAVEEIDDWARAELPGIIEAFSSEMFADGMELKGLRFSAALESLELTADGVTAGLTANLEPIDGPATCLPSGSSLPPEQKESPAAVMSQAHLSIAASEPFVQRAVRAAWLAGWMCFDTRDYDLGLGVYLTDLVPNATLEAVIIAPEPPSVRLGGVTDAKPIEVVLPALSAQLAIGAPQLATSLVDISTGATFAGQLGMDYSLQALVMGLSHVGTEGMNITAPGAELIFSPPALADLLDNLILPTFSDYLTNLPLTSSLFVSSPVATRLVEVGAQQGTHLRADLELVAIDRHDHQAPVTLMVGSPRYPSLPTFALQVASVDNSSPADFVRHRMVIDGVEVEQLFSGTTLMVEDLTAGQHDISIAAVDLNDNCDNSPVELRVFVDALPPVITVTESPKGLLSVDTATIRFAVADDYTREQTLRVRYQVSLVQVVGPDRPLRQGDLRPDQSLELDDLPEDAIIRVLLFAEDEAGNIGDAQVVFGINAVPTFSCRAAPGSWTGAALLLLLRRRRR